MNHLIVKHHTQKLEYSSASIVKRKKHNEREYPPTLTPLKFSQQGNSLAGNKVQKTTNNSPKNKV